MKPLVSSLHPSLVQAVHSGMSESIYHGINGKDPACREGTVYAVKDIDS